MIDTPRQVNVTEHYNVEVSDSPPIWNKNYTGWNAMGNAINTHDANGSVNGTTYSGYWRLENRSRLVEKTVFDSHLGCTCTSFFHGSNCSLDA